MNENCVKAGSGSGFPQEGVQSQTKIYEFISLMERQNNELEEIINMIFVCNDRIDGLANRLNSGEYPKNMPKDVGTESLKNGGTPESSSTGVILALEKLTDKKRSLMRTMDNNLLPNLREGLTYLEKHI